jgi:hypothetical protein
MATHCTPPSPCFPAALCKINTYQNVSFLTFSIKKTYLHPKICFYFEKFIKVCAGPAPSGHCADSLRIWRIC